MGRPEKAIIILDYISSKSVDVKKLLDEDSRSWRILFVLFKNVSGDFQIEGQAENTVILVLSGEPINEPIVMHGPFVMNSPEEISVS